LNTQQQQKQQQKQQQQQQKQQQQQQQQCNRAKGMVRRAQRGRRRKHQAQYQGIGV